MMLIKPGEPLEPAEPPDPLPGPGQVLLSVQSCGVCRTDLHLLDGELRAPRYPLIPGHQIVGRVAASGPGAARYRAGQRVGVPWLGWTCGSCRYCREGLENLCDQARFTGFHLDGGFATLAAADERYCYPIPEGVSDAQAAPLLCGGLIGYRALRLAGDPRRLGLYGFGSAAHMILQLARHEGREVLAFTRPGDRAAADFARALGASWAGGSDQLPPEPLDAALIFAPVGALVPAALRAVRKGGTVVCAGIHMSDIPSFPYADLWNERIVRSVANLTRKDGEEFLALAPRVPVRTEVRTLPLDAANEALAALRAGEVQGSLVLAVGP
jgi:propanol-preferring alcohol dehydrogenase